MKKIISLMCASLLSLSILFTFGCNEQSTGETKAVQVDLNPSVQFCVDENNKVISVTALNDDGAVIISGEVFIGKTIEEAIEKFVDEAKETGYLVEENLAGKIDELKVSVSGATEEATKLYNELSTKVNAYIEENGLAAQVAKGEALKREALEEAVLQAYPEMTEEEVEALSDSELANKLASAALEMAEVVSKEMRDAYYKSKEYFLAQVENSTIKEKLDEALNSNVFASLLLTAYDTANNLLDTAYTTIQDTYFDYFVDKDSQYQQAVASVLQAKAEFLEVKKQLSDKIDDQILQTALSTKEDLLTAAESTLNTAKSLAETAINEAGTAISTYKSKLDDAYSKISSFLTDTQFKLEDAVKTAKEKTNTYLADFESEFNADLDAYDKMIEDMKKSLTEQN